MGTKGLEMWKDAMLLCEDQTIGLLRLATRTSPAAPGSAGGRGGVRTLLPFSLFHVTSKAHLTLAVDEVSSRNKPPTKAMSLDS